MKKALFIAFVFIGFSAAAQNYNDSIVTVQLTQRAAVYIGQYVRTTFQWAERTAPVYMKDYIRNGTNLDSLFTVSVKASWVNGMIELLLASPNEMTQADRLSIINNSPSIPGYTALASQIVTLANGSSSQKQAAIFIRDYYNRRVAEMALVRSDYIEAVVNWSKN